MNIFLKAYQIKSVLYVQWILNFQDAWSKRKINIKILHASMKTLTNFKDWSGSRVIIFMPAPLSVTGRFYPVSTIGGRYSDEIIAFF
jgi:hypothetical protein